MKVSLFLSLFALAFNVQATSVKPPADAVRSNNQVGMTFMKAVTLEHLATEDKNIMTSPISMYLALSLAQNGTAGQTHKQLNEYLGAPKDVATLNAANLDLQNTLRLEQKEKANDWSPKPPVFGTYNSAWSSSGPSPSGGVFDFNTNYVQTIKSSYNAEVQRLNFLDASSADVVNKWANDRTQGLIPAVIDSDALSKLSWVLMNATYFEAAWRPEFHVVFNPQAPKFTTLAGQEKDVPLITTKAYMAYSNSETAEMIEVPFSGAELSFYIVAPKSDKTFSSLRANEAWSAEYWNQVISTLNEDTRAKGTLTLPKFSFGYSVSMKAKENLTDLAGLDFLFDDKADFSAMAAPGSVPTTVGLIKHDTKIELDEKGVKAAAVTTIGGMEATSVPAPPVYDMIVNKPFLFAIVNKANGALLFVGSVIDPTLTK